jgi:hypothetical protein
MTVSERFLLHIFSVQNSILKGMCHLYRIGSHSRRLLHQGPDPFFKLPSELRNQWQYFHTSWRQTPPRTTEKHGRCRRRPPKLHLVRTCATDLFSMRYRNIPNVSRRKYGSEINWFCNTWGDPTLIFVLTFLRGLRNIVAAVAIAHIFAFFFWIYKYVSNPRCFLGLVPPKKSQKHSSDPQVFIHPTAWHVAWHHLTILAAYGIASNPASLTRDFSNVLNAFSQFIIYTCLVLFPGSPFQRSRSSRTKHDILFACTRPLQHTCRMPEGLGLFSWLSSAAATKGSNTTPDRRDMSYKKTISRLHHRTRANMRQFSSYKLPGKGLAGFHNTNHTTSNF